MRSLAVYVTEESKEARFPAVLGMLLLNPFNQENAGTQNGWK